MSNKLPREKELFGILTLVSKTEDELDALEDIIDMKMNKLEERRKDLEAFNFELEELASKKEALEAEIAELEAKENLNPEVPTSTADLNQLVELMENELVDYRTVWGTHQNNAEGFWEGWTSWAYEEYDFIFKNFKIEHVETKGGHEGAGEEFWMVFKIILQVLQHFPSLFQFLIGHSQSNLALMVMGNCNSFSCNLIFC